MILNFRNQNHLKSFKLIYRALILGFLGTLVLVCIILYQENNYQKTLFDQAVSEVMERLERQVSQFETLSQSLSERSRFPQSSPSLEEYSDPKDLRKPKPYKDPYNLSYVMMTTPKKTIHNNSDAETHPPLPIDPKNTITPSPSLQRTHECLVVHSTSEILKGVNLCADPHFAAKMLKDSNKSFLTFNLGSKDTLINQNNNIHFITKKKIMSDHEFKHDKILWTIVSVPTHYFFEKIFKGNLALTVYINDSKKRKVFSSTLKEDGKGVFATTKITDFGSNRLELRIRAHALAPPLFSQQLLYGSIAFCFLLTLLLGHLVWSLTRARHKTKRIAENFQNDLYRARLNNRSMIENIPGTVYRAALKDQTWIIEYMSDYIYEMVGYPAAKYVEKNRLEVLQFLESDIVSLKNALFHSNALGAYQLEYQAYHADGSRRWLLEHGHIVKDKDNQKFCVAIIFDVSEHKEKNLRMKTLHTALQNAVEGISFISNDLIVIESNQAFSEIFALNPSQISGQPLLDFLHPEDGSLLQDEIRKKPNNRFNIIARPLASNNDFTHLHLVFVPIASNEIFISGYYCFARDITPLLQKEKAMAEALEKATIANQTKSNFLATVSHELRTPLNAIIGYSDLILEEEHITRNLIKADVEKIRKAGMDLLELINNILDASKLEAGKIELCYESFDIFSFTESLTLLLMPNALKKKNAIILDCPRDIGSMSCDSMRLRQCLINLLSNACKFTDHGTINFRVRRFTKTNVPMIIFDVMDTGQGINPSALEKIFEPFTQEDSTTTRRFGGTGLGLTITKQFTELLGGHIEVKTEYGRGSIFTLYIPEDASKYPRASVDRMDTKLDFKEVI